MKCNRFLIAAGALLAAGTLAAQAQLSYTFDSDVEGFQNVTWSATDPAGWAGSPTVKQSHATGGWQVMLTKEFSYEAGGGVENQQLAMQELANNPDARLSFDLVADGTSFPAGMATWFQAIVVGNSDGAAGWTQNQVFDGYHNADDATLVTQHIDEPFSYFGWEPGDTWFQLYTGANSDGAVAVSWYLDNVNAYVVPEPSSLALGGLCVAALLIRRRS